MRALVLIGVVLAVALAGLAAILLGSLGSGSSGSTLADDSDGRYRGSEVPADTFLPSFSLRSYTGELVRTQSLQGKVALVTFLESKCEEACPIIAAEIAQGLALLTAAERRQVAAVAVSTHPGD